MLTACFLKCVTENPDMTHFSLTIFGRRTTHKRAPRPSDLRLSPSSFILHPASFILLPLALAFVAGCAEPYPPFDRPFPLGQVTDSHWDTQMTNAQASSFIFYDHEFIGDTAKLNVLGQKHLVQVALRLRHVPFPVVVEETPNHQNPKLDADRRQAVLERFAELGLHGLDCRVVIAPAIAEGMRGTEAEQTYRDSSRTIEGFGQTGVGGFGSAGGQYR